MTAQLSPQTFDLNYERLHYGMRLLVAILTFLINVHPLCTSIIFPYDLYDEMKYKMNDMS